MRYNFDQEIDRNGSKCEKYDNLLEVFGRDDIIPAWVADTDFATPDFVMKAVEERAKHPILGYSFRDEMYYNSVMGWLERRSGWKVEREWLEFSPGVVFGIAHTIDALTNIGDKIVIQPPVYPPFERTILANNRVVVTNPLIKNGDKYSIDFDGFEKALIGAKLFILCNPHNPVGRVFTGEELKTMGDLCVKHGVKIIADEIHSDLIFSGNNFVHIASISPEIAAITVSLVAPSKTFNTAGLSTSVIIIPNEEIMAIYKQNLNRVHIDQGNIFGAVALEAAYNGGDEWLDELIPYLEANAEFVVKYIAEYMPKIQTYKPEATFLMWLDCSELGMSHDDLCMFFLNEAKVGLNSGTAFGYGGEKHVRLNIGTTLKKLETILGRVKEAYDKLG